MKWPLIVVAALFASVVALVAMFVLSARAAARAAAKAMVPQKKLDELQQKTKSNEHAIDEKADAERQEVANADGKTLVERIRARLARGLRR